MGVLAGFAVSVAERGLQGCETNRVGAVVGSLTVFSEAGMSQSCGGRNLVYAVLRTGIACHDSTKRSDV